jgi:pantoate--beta-alanine ligase
VTSLVVTTKAALRAELAAARSAGRTVGLVPTMGYLHEGHASLARRARAENDLVVLTVFVNPTQFAPGEDLDRYPRDLPRDLAVAEAAGVDLVFHPDADEMYDPGHATWVDVEGLADHLCGARRPGHFRGIATVVTKLLALCRPDRAYFGQKDAQQAFIVTRLAADLDLSAEIIVCPIVREADGLAMSSRNVYLTPEEREQAPALFAALGKAEALVAAGERDAGAVVAAVGARLAQAQLAQVEYVELVATGTLTPIARLEGRVLLALAVRFGRTRLIDNTVLDLG